MLLADKNFHLESFVKLIDDLYDEVAIWDKDCNLIYINKACYRHYGLHPEDMVGKNLKELSFQQKYWEPTVVPYTFSRKREVMQKQRTLLGTPIVTISVPVFDDDGEVVYVLQSVRDGEEALALKLAPVKPLEEQTSVCDKVNLIYKSNCMEKIMNFAKKIATTDAPCLILGETGTGKSLLAKYIHLMSDRKDKPFFSINMASINPNLIESELFGYKKGAFTGADHKGKKGLFEMAQGGTLFLDEIGEIPKGLQSKFLHIIQEGELLSIGSVNPVKVDVKLITATNCDLKKMVDAGRFREDLYHRLNVFEITIPALRERKEDLNLLTSYFLNVFNKKYSKNCFFSEEALEIINHHLWKGNVRELSNVIERGVLTASENKINATELPNSLFRINPLNLDTGLNLQHIHDFKSAIENYEKLIISQAYNKYGSSRKIAKALGISQTKANVLVRKYMKNDEKEINDE